MDTCSIAASVNPLKLDTSQFVENYWASIYRVSVILISFLSISLDSYCIFTSQNLSLLLQTSSSRIFRPRSSFSSLGKGPNPSFSCISCIWPNFLGFFFWNFWGFQNWWGFYEIFGMGFVFLILKNHTLHLICIITTCHAFFDVCLLCCKHVWW